MTRLQDFTSTPANPIRSPSRCTCARILKHRTLIIMLTDLDDAAADAPLARALALLSPPHLVVVAAVQSPEIAHLARQSAHDWRDPWVALAALEHERRSESRRLQLAQLGTPVIATAEHALQEAVFSAYETAAAQAACLNSSS